MSNILIIKQYVFWLYCKASTENNREDSKYFKTELFGHRIKAYKTLKTGVCHSFLKSKMNWVAKQNYKHNKQLH